MNSLNVIPSAIPCFAGYPATGASSIHSLAKTAAKLSAKVLLRRATCSSEGFTHLKALATCDAVAALAVAMVNLINATDSIAVARTACCLAETARVAETRGSREGVNEAAQALAEAARTACSNSPLASVARALCAARSRAIEAGSSCEELDWAACALVDGSRSNHIISPQVLATRSLLAARSLLTAETVAVDAIVRSFHSI